MILTFISQSPISKSKQPRYVIKYIPNLNAVVPKKFTISKLDGRLL